MLSGSEWVFGLSATLWWLVKNIHFKIIPIIIFIQNISPFFWFALILRLILQNHVARTKFRRCVYYTIFDVQVTLTSMKVYCQYTIIQTKRQRRGMTIEFKKMAIKRRKSRINDWKWIQIQSKNTRTSKVR